MLRNFYWAILNSALPSALAFFATIFIARIIAPDQYLKIALLLSYFGLMNVIIDGGLSQKLLVKPILTEGGLEYVQKFVNFRAIFVIIFSALLIYSVGKYQSYSVFEGLLSFLIPIMCAYNFKQNIVFNRRKLFKEKTMLSCYAAFYSVCAAIFFTYLGYPTIGMLLLNILSVSILSVLMRLRLKEKIVPNISVAFALPQFKRVNFALLAQMAERADELVKRTTLEFLSAKLPTPEIARNESLLNGPIKLVNKAVERVILSNWGPLRFGLINRSAVNIFLVVSFITSVLIFVTITAFGTYIVSYLIGYKWQLEDDIYSKIGIILSLKYFSSQLIHYIKSSQKNFSIAFCANLVSLFILIIPMLMIDISISMVLDIFILAYLSRLLLSLFAGLYYARASA